MKFAFFPAFMEHPTKMRFADQEENEEIELILRQHWVVNVPWIFYSILSAFFPIVLLNIGNWTTFSFLPSIPSNLIFASLAVWYLLITAYVVESFLHWYFNIYIVTNLHLVDIDFNNLLSKKLVEISLLNIESASGSINGITQSFFNYGDVLIRTAAEAEPITFLKVPYPTIVVDRINDLKRLLQSQQP